MSEAHEDSDNQFAFPECEGAIRRFKDAKSLAQFYDRWQWTDWGFKEYTFNGQ
jgi:hypothetical protein